MCTCLAADPDECTMGTDDCVDGATCMNTVGSFTCTCPPGFRGNGRVSPGGSGCTGIPRESMLSLVLCIMNCQTYTPVHNIE